LIIILVFGRNDKDKQVKLLDWLIYIYQNEEYTFQTKTQKLPFFCLRIEAPTLRLHLPLLVSGYGGLNSLSLELYNKLYLDNKLSYYIRVAVW